MELKSKVKAPVKDYSVKIPRFFFELWDMLKTNLGICVVFVLLYAVVNAIVTPTIIHLLINLALTLNGVTYLGPDNLSRVALSPWTFLLAIPALITIIFPPIFEVSGLLHAFSMGKVGRKTSVGGIISAGLHACRRSFKPQNWLIILFFAVILPLTGVLSFSSGTLSVSIPEFIRDFIFANSVYSKLYALLYAVMLIIEIVYIFMLNFYILEEADFTAACRGSRKLIKGRYMLTVWWMLFTFFVFFVFSVCLSSLLAEFLIRISNIFVGTNGSITNSTRIINAANIFRNIFVGIFAPVINIAAVNVLFYEYIEETSSLVKVSKRAFTDLHLSRVQVAVCAAVVAVFIGLNIYTSGFGFMRLEDTPKPQIVAHRGDSVRAPENTIPAFKMAILENPDWVEFDVHETADGVIVVSHDDDLTRVSGKNLFVHELTYEDTRTLDVGSWFSSEYSYVRLATLDETLKLFKDQDILLQIEIKPSEFDFELEEKVLQIIDDNDMRDRCVITSLNLDTLLRIEELDPDTVTVYSMFVAWENIEDIPVDLYTIEESNVNPGIVRSIHEAGKKIFAWTANTEDTVQYLADCGVDGILTDDPIMMKNALERIQTNDGILRQLRMCIQSLIKGY